MMFIVFRFYFTRYFHAFESADTVNAGHNILQHVCKLGTGVGCLATISRWPPGVIRNTAKFNKLLIYASFRYFYIDFISFILDKLSHIACDFSEIKFELMIKCESYHA